MAMTIGIGVLMILNGRQGKPLMRSDGNSLVESRSPTLIHKPGLIWMALSMLLFERWMSNLLRLLLSMVMCKAPWSVLPIRRAVFALLKFTDIKFRL